MSLKSVTINDDSNSLVHLETISFQEDDEELYSVSNTCSHGEICDDLVGFTFDREWPVQVLPNFESEPPTLVGPFEYLGDTVMTIDLGLMTEEPSETSLVFDEV